MVMPELNPVQRGAEPCAESRAGRRERETGNQEAKGAKGPGSQRDRII